MSQRVGPSSSTSTPQSDQLDNRRPRRPIYLWLALCILLINGSWAVYHFHFENLPVPLTAKEAGKRGFSEFSAMEHVKHLTGLGPHPVGSDALDLAVQYVMAVSEEIKKIAQWEVDVQIDLFHAKTGANRLVGGLFKGKTLIYSDLKHVVLRILPKYLPEAEENVILVSSHIDTVFSGEGAGDCSSCVGVMLELARVMSQWAHGFKNGVMFLFNTGEEEGLNGAHSFITQHPWSNTVRFVVDLEAIGVGGKSSIFQSGPDPWPIETYASVAKYPSGQILAQDLFLSGAISSATDFQVYKEVAGLSGLDFAYADNSAVYHTKNDKLKLLKPGSLQHLGENMVAYLLRSAMSPKFERDNGVEKGEDSSAVFFDILGIYMVVYRQRLAKMLHNSVLVQSLLLWVTSLLMGGPTGRISFALSCLSIILMWIFSISLSVLVAFIISYACSSPMPYVANPWLVIGLFGAPSVLGAFGGQHLGFLFLQKHLQRSFQNNLANLEAERWLFKAGFVQWLALLFLGNYYNVGSSYIALVWLVSPAFAYGLMEATLSPARAPKPLKIFTLILGLALPVILSAGGVIRLVGTLIANLVRFERHPGSSPLWIGNVIVAIFVAAVCCLTLVYILSYVHLSGVKWSIVFSLLSVFCLTLAVVSFGILPAFTEDISRAINVVHVVETTANNDGTNPSSFVSLSSVTPGELTEEVNALKDDFICGKNKTVDFVTFTVKYGCWSTRDTESGWSASEIPILRVESDAVANNGRVTRIFIDTRLSTRWALSINTKEIADFTLEENAEELVSQGKKTTKDGWHIIQFAGGKNSPTKFHLNLFWTHNATRPSRTISQNEEGIQPLLKLRTDVNRVTPVVSRVLQKLPPWCALFGKSTGPHTLAYLTSLPIDF